MNKTININLSGIIYHLCLRENAIKDRLSHEEGGAEVEIYRCDFLGKVVIREDVDFKKPEVRLLG